MAESYDDEGIYEEEVPEGGGGEPLHELLSHAPWWMVSVFVHAVALIVIMLLSSAPPAPHVVTSFEVSMLNDETIPPDDQEEAWEEEKELDPEKEPVEDPVHKPNAEVSDHPESDVDKDFKENLGKNENAISDTECNAKSTHTTFGLGAGAAGAFTGRGGGADRAERGDGRGTKRPTDDGLRWLAAHQDKARGCWDSDDFQAQCKNNTCSGRGVDWGDPGVTGIALLAFLGAGNTNQKGKYKETVKLGLKYLTEIQDDDGCFGPRGKISMYNHAIAALAMAEAFGMTESGLLKDPAQKGIDFLVSAQNPGFGWRYTAKPGDNDTSVTGWAVMALK
ncbi:MAG: terpene cyclase/mutase family protein, partial [Planctomycetes bacterium]|nr:terpene cyclase/mutase family protein [Planctomycetota bacterium]